MKQPETFILKEQEDGKSYQIKTFDSSMLIFQIVLILVPFLLIEILLVRPDTFNSVSIFIIGLTIIGYWICTNIYGKYEITIKNEFVEFKYGYPLPKSKKIHVKDIINLKIKRRSGKSITGGRAGVTTTGPDVDDYLIITKKGEYKMIPSCSKKEKEFIKLQIENLKKKITGPNIT